MTIAADIKPGDDPEEVSRKLMGSSRTRLMKDLLGLR